MLAALALPPAAVAVFVLLLLLPHACRMNAAMPAAPPVSAVRRVN